MPDTCEEKTYMIIFPEGNLGRGTPKHVDTFTGTVKELESHIDQIITCNNSYLSTNIGWQLNLETMKGFVSGGFQKIGEFTVTELDEVQQRTRNVLGEKGGEQNDTR